MKYRIFKQVFTLLEGLLNAYKKLGLRMYLLQVLNDMFSVVRKNSPLTLLCRAHNDSHGKISPNPLHVKNLFSYSPISLLPSKRCAFTKPSRCYARRHNKSQQKITEMAKKTNEVRDKRQSTETLSFRCCRERCRLEDSEQRVNATAYSFNANCPKLGAAFTLAETLITLGIIGVVAALTLPSVIQNYRNKETTIRLKKFYSIMSQAIISAEAEFGEKAYEWDTVTTLSLDAQKSYDDTYNYYNKYIAPYVKTLKVVKGVHDKEKNISNKTKVYFNDGSTMELNSGYCVSLYFDTNGDKNPNELGRDKFIFFIATATTHNLPREAELYYNHSFAVVYLPQFNTIDKALAACKRNAIYCSTYLMYTNFEITKDYPYRI